MKSVLSKVHDYPNTMQRTCTSVSEYSTSSVTLKPLTGFFAGCLTVVALLGMDWIVFATNSTASPVPPVCPTTATIKATLGGSPAAESSATKPATSAFDFTTITCKYGYSSNGDTVMFESTVTASEFSHWYPSALRPKGKLAGLGSAAFWDKYPVLTKTRENQVFVFIVPYVITIDSLNATIAREVALARLLVPTV